MTQPSAEAVEQARKWPTFVRGKTIESASEESSGWNVLNFTDGTSFHFTSDDGFVLVEAQTQ